MELKKCTQCNEEKSLNRFYTTTYKGNKKHVARCKDCYVREARKYRKENKEKIQQSRSIYREKNHAKIIEQNKKQWDKNKDEFNRRRREARKNNPDRYYSVIKEWRKNNPDKIRQYKLTEWHKNKLENVCRLRIRTVLKGTVKKHYRELIGCDNNFLKQWFKFNFEIDEYLDLNYDNLGIVWHVDHVIPCNAFNIGDNEQLKKCFNWKNLTPLLKEINLAKSNKIDKHYIFRQELRLYIFNKSLKSNL